MKRRLSEPAQPTTEALETSALLGNTLSFVSAKSRTSVREFLTSSRPRLRLRNYTGSVIDGSDFLNSTKQSILDDESDFPSDWVVTLGVVLGIAIALLGIGGNSVTIAAYKRNRKLRTTFNFLIINLCAVDLVFSALLIVTHVTMMLAKRNLYEEIGCQVFGYLHHCSISSSAVNLVCIAINRYVGIVHSKWYKYMFAPEFAKWWVAGIWMFAPMLYLPLVISNPTGWSDSTLRCDLFFVDRDDVVRQSYQIFLLVFLQLLPVVALAGFYRAILQKVKKCRKSVEHYPLTNTMSNGGGSCTAGQGRGPRSTASPDFSPIPNCRDKSPRRSPSGKRRSDVLGIEHDSAVSRGAMIMAYLQVPPTAISPRKSPGALYKRSPPQTRTMVVEEEDGRRHQVLISGTTSSPDLMKEKDPTFVDGTRKRLTLKKWNRQRSFSTGDEEIEPERGMVGDDESDLKQMSSFNISGKAINRSRSYDEESVTLQSTPPDENQSKSHDFSDETIRASCIDPSSASSGVNNPGGKPPHEADDTKKLKYLPDKFVRHFFPKSAANKMLSQRPAVLDERVDSVEQKSDSSTDSSKRKFRMLLRQKVVEDDSVPCEARHTLALPPNKCESPHLSMILNNNPPRFSETGNTEPRFVSHCGDARNDAIESTNEQDDSVETYHDAKNSASPTQGPVSVIESRRLNYAYKPSSTSSDRGYVSQSVDFLSTQIERGPGRLSKDRGQDGDGFTAGETALSKRVLYRRGASDNRGAHWFTKFRKSKNWSVTSRKPSKHRVRRLSSFRKDTAIRIVIDPVTEEAGELSIGEDLMRSQGSVKSSQNERTDIPTDSATPPVHPNSCVDAVTKADTQEIGGGKSRRWRYTNFWKRWLQNNPFVRRQQAAENKPTDPEWRGEEGKKKNTAVDVRDEGVGTTDEESESGRSKAQLSPDSSACNASINGASAPFKPMVMLPMPNLSLRTNDPALPRAQANILEDESSFSAFPFMDSNDDCRDPSFVLYRRQPSVETRNTSSRLGSGDSDVISRAEDATILAKRRARNTSNQFLRVSNAPNEGDENGDGRSIVDLDSIDLGRRWSGQSDMISIYSDRVEISLKKPVERSYSACSRTLPRKGSKKNERDGGDNRARRKSYYRKWSSSKKSSVASSNSTGSTRRRKREAEKKLAFSGVLICIAFAFFMLPSSAVDLLRQATSTAVPAEVRLGVVALSWLHVVANPFLYGFLNSKFRSEYRKIARDTVSCLHPSRKGGGLLSGNSAIVKRLRDQCSVNSPQMHCAATTSVGFAQK